jgi:DNA polymerase-3 subunit delta'
MIIWMADKLNIAASNIIKAAGRATRKDGFILISENEEDLIQTIRSCCQILHFNGLSEPIITEALVAIEKTNKHMAKNRTSHREITTLP